MNCPHCQSSSTTEWQGRTVHGFRRFGCRECGRRFTARAQCQGPLNLGKPDGAPLPEGRRRGQAFGEDPARAAGVRAAEAADLEGQGDDAAHQGKVGDMADVAAVQTEMSRLMLQI